MSSLSGLTKCRNGALEGLWSDNIHRQSEDVQESVPLRTRHYQLLFALNWWRVEGGACPTKTVIINQNLRKHKGL